MPHNSTRGSIDPVDRTGLEQCRPRMRGWAQTEAARAWPSGEWNDHIRASSARQIQTSSVSRLGPQPYEMAMVTPEGQCLWSLWLVDRGVPYRGMGSTTGFALSLRLALPSTSNCSHASNLSILGPLSGVASIGLAFASSPPPRAFQLRPARHRRDQSIDWRRRNFPPGGPL